MVIYGMFLVVTKGAAGDRGALLARGDRRARDALAVPAHAGIRLGMHRYDRRRGHRQRRAGVSRAGLEERCEDADVDGGILLFLFVGIWLAVTAGVRDVEPETVISQLSRQFFGTGLIYYAISEEKTADESEVSKIQVNPNS